MFTQTSCKTKYDVIVIGGGAAGLSGALALVRSRRSVLVIDSAQPRNAPSAHMHNYLSRDGTSPLEFLAIGRAEVVGYGGEVINATVTTIHQLSNPTDQYRFELILNDRTKLYARRLLVTTGLIDHLPDIPGLAERWGRDVLHCPYCHGWEVRDQAIGIIGSGPMAVHSTLLFRQLSSDIVFFQHTAPPLTAEQHEKLIARNITIIKEPIQSIQIEQDQIVGVQLVTGEIIPRQALAVQSYLEARSNMLNDLGLEISNMEVQDHVIGKHIAADAIGTTSVAGVWVAGNITDLSGTVISAAASGMKTGAFINADLIDEETLDAVATLQADQPLNPRSNDRPKAQPV